MSYNGSGTFQINTTGQPVVGGTIISSATFNALTADLATGLTTAITKDGQTTTTARILFAQGINSTLVTDASSVSTGSIFTAGGVGIAKKLYVGTDANIAGNATITGDTSTTGNATITGTLGVTGVATFSAAPIYSSLTASSAVATNASKALVSVTNTGTGSNVLATSPTITSATIASANLTTALTLAGAAGTNGQVLTSAGSGLPTWTTLSSASGLTLLSTVTASASATVDMETTFSSTYDAYLIIGSGIVISNDGGSFSCRLKIGGSYSSTDYKGHYMQVASGSTAYAATGNVTDSIRLASGVGNVTDEGLNFTMNVYLPSGTTLRNMVTGQVISTKDNADVLQGGAFLGGNTVAGAVTGVRFLPSSGTITSGVFRLYGFANS